MIHLTRRQSITVAGSLIGVFFFAMWLLSRGSAGGVVGSEVSKEAATPGVYPTPQQGAQFLLNDFHRSEVRDGRKIWEVKAAKGEYFPDKQMAQIVNADVWLFRPNDEMVILNAPEAQIHLNGATLSKAYFPGTVHVVYNDKFVVDTSVATYDKATDTIVSDHPVTLTSEMLDVSGNRFTANSAENSITISGGVTTVIKPQGKKR